ncbi:MAG TPA: maltose alpha-D-glucosyltransferase, partial [Candidatus Binatia bacterium]|nr:maltose alpha-D-glucosyltransferase [Candidatus Binatia bacterium]
MAGKGKKRSLLGDDPFWYQDAVIYELHVRSFFDSDDDGIGDFRGLTEKLDYLQDLGVTALWVLPFYPSPLKDDGYDISNYTAVNPAYGELSDFRLFLREAHHRGLRVITELVLNHTSDQHPWFQRARRSPPGSKWRDFYVWSDSPEKYRDARIIFKDFESSNWTWDPVANAYYWHRFYSHQPDLNFDSPEVRRIMLTTMQFWLAMGVDGLRLDAVPYLYEREGTSCENLAETHKALKTIRKRVDERYPNRMLLAEANQWPEDAAAYFGDGDECHMAYHFPLMPRMFMAIRMEDRYPITDILSQTPPIHANCQWALFLRNHDELTLEMVTDEERDYMYRVYANDPHARINLGIRRRLYPLLGKDRKKFELMNALLLSLPGTPVLYYGDEIGMGDNIYIGDRNGVRTPMQWNSDRNAGFSRARSQKLFLPVTIDPDYHYETVNVEARQNNPSSMLWWMKRVIALRRQFKAFGRGTIEFLTPENHKVLAFLRSFGNELILVVANLSRFPQFVELDLSSHKGKVPVELVGKTEFPSIKDSPYFLTLGAHIFYWFSLESPDRETETATIPAETPAPILNVKGGPDSLFRKDLRGTLERILPAYLRTRRWFGGKARRMKWARILETIPLANATAYPHLLLV